MKYESFCGFGELIDHLPDLRSIFAVERSVCSLPLCAGNAGADASLSALCALCLPLCQRRNTHVSKSSNKGRKYIPAMNPKRAARPAGNSVPASIGYYLP